MMRAVCDYLPSPDDIRTVTGVDPRTKKNVERQLSADQALAALAFKSVVDLHGDLVYLRIYSGVLKTSEQVLNMRTQKRERVQKIYVMHANHRESVESARAGEIVAVVGLKSTVTGDSLAAPGSPILLEPPVFPAAVVAMAIEPVSIADRDRLIGSLDKLQREDPTFHWRFDGETGQLIVGGMGELHLEVLKERMLREFRVDAAVGTPKVAYRQTIRADVVGEGVFERQVGGVNHYARVVVRLETASAETEPVVESRLRKEDVPLEFHPAVLDGIKGALGSGGILGFPLCQLRAIVEGAEFRQGEGTGLAFTAAASAAFDAALEAAGTTLLEPIMRFEIRVPEDYYGAVSGDLNQRRAEIREVALEHDLRVIRGRVPLAEVFGYSNTLRSLSQGRGAISLEPEAYAAVPEEVAERFRF